MSRVGRFCEFFAGTGSRAVVKASWEGGWSGGRRGLHPPRLCGLPFFEPRN